MLTIEGINSTYFQMKILYIAGLIILTFSYQTKAQSKVSAPKFETSRDSSYYATYNKLKQLFIEQMNTPEYQNYRIRLLAYKKKLRSTKEFKVSFLLKDQGGLNWLKDNWERTEFTSYEEAVSEFNKLVESASAVDKKHPKFNNYNTQAILKYGPEIYTDVFLEIMAEYPDKF